MADIPRVERQVTTQVDQSLRLDPSAAWRQYDVDLTRNNDSAARGLQDLAHGVMILAKQKEETDLTKRINDFNSEMQYFQYDNDIGTLMTTPGELSNGVTDKTVEYSGKLRDAYGKGLSKSNFEKFAAATDGIILGARTTAMKHETVEMGKYRQQESEKTIASAAALWANDPFSIGVGSGETNAMELAVRDTAGLFEGQPEEVKQKALENIIKQLTAKTLEKVVAQTPLRAREFYSNNKDAFSETERPSIEAYIDEAVIPAEAEVYANDFVAKYGWNGGLEKSEEEIEKMPANVQKEFRAQRDDKRKIAYDQYQQASNAITNDIFAAITAGNQRLANNLFAQGKKLWEANGDAQQAFNIKNTIKNAFAPKAPPALSALGRTNIYWDMVNLIDSGVFASEQDMYEALYRNPESPYYGRFDPRAVGEVHSAWAAATKGSGAEGTVTSVGVYQEPLNQLVDRMIIDPLDRANFKNSMNIKYAKVANQMSDEERFNAIRRELTSQQIVNIQKTGLFRGNYLEPAVISNYAHEEFMGSVPGGLVFNPTSKTYTNASGGIMYFDPNFINPNTPTNRQPRATALIEKKPKLPEAGTAGSTAIRKSRILKEAKANELIP